MTRVKRPPFDPEIERGLELMKDQMPSSITPEMIQSMRDGMALMALPIAEQIGDRPIEWTETEIPGADGNMMPTTIFRKKGVTGPAPCIVHCHGGGMIIGDRFTGSGSYLDWVNDFGAIVVTSEYRLAPEHPHPAPSEDCYAALLWTAEHAEELGVDMDRLVIGGASAGGGLAAAVALMARDRKGPKLAAQILIYPMLDDRNDTVSSHQIDGEGVWDRTSNDTGWTALLGDQRGGPDVSPYAAPARATDLSGLPPTYLDATSCEVFRDEIVEYATRIWQAGGDAELHVWPGGCHGFDDFLPQTALARAAKKVRNEWVGKILAN